MSYHLRLYSIARLFVPADMQSVSVNVGPKDIKKESGGQQAANPCGNFMGSNDMQIPASNHGGEDTIGDGLSSLINDTDLDVDIEVDFLDAWVFIYLFRCILFSWNKGILKLN